jgi:hypothetical protein
MSSYGSTKESESVKLINMWEYNHSKFLTLREPTTLLLFLRCSFLARELILFDVKRAGRLISWKK